jgi:hypothetical protein
VETHAGAARGAVENLQWHLTHALGPRVQVDDGMDTLDCLTLDDMIPGHTGVKEHIVSGEPLGVKSAFDPGHKATVKVG